MKTKKVKPVKAWSILGIDDEILIEEVAIDKMSPFDIRVTIILSSDYKAMLKELKRFKTMEKIAIAWRKSLVPMDNFNKEGIWKWKFGGEIK